MSWYFSAPCVFVACTALTTTICATPYPKDEYDSAYPFKEVKIKKMNEWITSLINLKNSTLYEWIYLWDGIIEYENDLCQSRFKKNSLWFLEQKNNPVL